MKTDLDLRLMRDFMDILILRMLEKSSSTSGYSLIRYFHHRFHLLVSSGSVYSKLYSLERQGFLEGVCDGKRRVYRLTEQGEEYLSRIRMTEQRNRAAFLSIFSAASG